MAHKQNQEAQSGFSRADHSGRWPNVALVGLAVFGLGHHVPSDTDLALVWQVILGALILWGLAQLWKVPRRSKPSQSETAISHESEGTGAPDNQAEDAQRLAQLHEIARRDPLTGVLNRSEFRRIVSAAIAQAGAQPAGVVLFIDLDNFKAVNDTHGHFRGDALLQTCARRLEMIDQFAAQSSADGAQHANSPTNRLHVARFGGDEFAAFIEGPVDRDELERILRRTLRALIGDVHLGGRAISISASIGAAFLPDHGDTFDELMMAADAAMYSAKAHGKNRFEVYSERLDAKARQEALEENELTTAIAEGQLTFVYQPVFDLRTTRIVSAEALVRWQHPQKGLLSPADFFDALHRARLVKPFSEWCIGEIIRTISELHERGAPIMVAANISPEQLSSLEFISVIKSNLERWNCPADLLQIEVTEDAAMRDPELTIASLNKLHELGITLAIDDFGVGYSNLVSLTRLPLSRLKVDRSLLHALDEQPATFVLMQTVLNLANSLGLHSVVEGVETQKQLEMVTSMGADFAQGFLLSHPLSLEQLIALNAASDIIAGSKDGRVDALATALENRPAWREESARSPTG